MKLLHAVPTLALVSTLTFAQSYDPSTNKLTIPVITVSGTTYSQVVAVPDRVVSYNLGTPVTASTYDTVSGVLTVPEIVVAGARFTNVKVTIASIVSTGSQRLATVSSY